MTELFARSSYPQLFPELSTYLDLWFWLIMGNGYTFKGNNSNMELLSPCSMGAIVKGKNDSCGIFFFFFFFCGCYFRKNLNNTKTNSSRQKLSPFDK